MRRPFKYLAVVVVFGFSLVGWYGWDSTRNHGLTFGYYGQFNCTYAALASIPGVAITNAWYNHDVSLEEFGFDVVVTGKPVRLFFGERDPIRTMNRDRARAALQTLINAELALPK